jgi:hypothetical protein
MRATDTLAGTNLIPAPGAISESEQIARLKGTLLKSIRRSAYVFRIDCGGCNGCEIEIFAAFSPIFDAERYGIRLVASLTDAVDKVRGVLLECNNRIIGADFLNQTCASDARFGSVFAQPAPRLQQLRGLTPTRPSQLSKISLNRCCSESPKNPFSIVSTPMLKSAADHLVSPMPAAARAQYQLGSSLADTPALPERSHAGSAFRPSAESWRQGRHSPG